MGAVMYATGTSIARGLASRPRLNSRLPVNVQNGTRKEIQNGLSKMYISINMINSSHLLPKL